MIFVEGLKYDKLVARNGEADRRAREQAQVEKDMRQSRRSTGDGTSASCRRAES